MNSPANIATKNNNKINLETDLEIVKETVYITSLLRELSLLLDDEPLLEDVGNPGTFFYKPNNDIIESIKDILSSKKKNKQNKSTNNQNNSISKQNNLINEQPNSTNEQSNSTNEQSNFIKIRIAELKKLGINLESNSTTGGSKKRTTKKRTTKKRTIKKRVKRN